MYLPKFLADHTNGPAYATVMLRLSPSVVVSELWINDASLSKIRIGPTDSLQEVIYEKSIGTKRMTLTFV